MRKTITLMKKKTKSSLFHRLTVHSLSLALALPVVTAAIAIPFALTPAAHAQSKQPTVRTIEGEVEHDGHPATNAVVFLKDTRTMQVKSYLADDHGHFRFGELSLATDYDLWAELKGQHSATKHVSSFNSHPDLHYTLNIK